MGVSGMLRLIEKDILFNWKWALLLALVAVIMPLAFYVDLHETRLVLLVYIIGAVLANSHLVSKSCYLDDGAQTRRFLASLPVSKAQLVLSKYALGLMCIVASLVLTSLSSLALGIGLSVRGLLIASIYLLLYYAIFLGTFFRSNYSNAEKTHTALLMLTVASAFVIDRGGLQLDGMVVNLNALLAGLGVCALVFAASAFSSDRFAGRFQGGKE